MNEQIADKKWTLLATAAVAVLLLIAAWMMGALSSATRSEGGSVGFKCPPDPDTGVEFVDHSFHDTELVHELLQVTSPGDLGQGKRLPDNIKNKRYKGIEIREVHKVNQTKLWSRYNDIWEADDTEKYELPTIFKAELQEKLRSNSSSRLRPRFDMKNEYLLLHGTPGKEIVQRIMCEGFINGKGPNSGGAFGQGIYLADRLEKADHYCGSDGEDRWVLVVRAFLGKRIQVQREDEHHEWGKKKTWHWFDKFGNMPTHVSITNKTDFVKPPDNYSDWDSIEVMSTMSDANFSEKWEKHHSDISKTMPVRFKEYVIPFEKNGKIQLLVEYAVRYRYIRNKKSE